MKHNANTDAHSPTNGPELSQQKIVAAVTDADVPAKEGEPNITLAERQQADPELQVLWEYLADQALPQDNTQVCSA